MARKVITQAEAYALKTKVAELEKTIESNKSTLAYREKSIDDLNRDVESIHKVLDCLPFPPKRKNKNSYNPYTAAERLNIWISTFVFQMFGRETAVKAWNEKTYAVETD